MPPLLLGLLCAVAWAPVDSVSGWVLPPSPLQPSMRALGAINPHAGGCAELPVRSLRPGAAAMRQKRESWMESDSTTIMGRSRTPASDAGMDEDDYTVLDLEVISRATRDLQARRAALGLGSEPEQGAEPDADALTRAGFHEQSMRKVREAERLFVAALEANRKCGAAWYGLGSLLHETQHGGLERAAAASRTLGLQVPNAAVMPPYDGLPAVEILGNTMPDAGRGKAPKGGPGWGV